MRDGVSVYYQVLGRLKSSILSTSSIISTQIEQRNIWKDNSTQVLSVYIALRQFFIVANDFSAKIFLLKKLCLYGMILKEAYQCLRSILPK